jgi:hypothetical protein
MLVKINKINDAENRVNATLLDIDELGSIIPMKDLNLNLPPYDESVLNILKASTHAIIFTEDFNNEDNCTVISAINLTDEEVNKEKEQMINAANDKKRN